MPWVRLDDRMAFNAKVVVAGNLAVGIRDRLLTWASANKTGGFVPQAIAVAIASGEPFLESIGVTLPAAFADHALAWMVAHRVLDPASGGYQIHDAGEYELAQHGTTKPSTSNLTSAQREQRRQAGKKSAEARRNGAVERSERSPLNGANETSVSVPVPVERGLNGSLEFSTGYKDARIPFPIPLSLTPGGQAPPLAQVSPSQLTEAGSALADAAPVGEPVASYPSVRSDASLPHGCGVDTSGRSSAVLEPARALAEPPANSTQDSPLCHWAALGTLAGDEVDGIDPRRLVSKLDMAVNAACAWYPKAAEIPRAWLAQRLAGKLASHVADRPASSPDQRLAVLVKSIEYVVGDVRNKRANPFEAPTEAPQQRPARSMPMSFAERDEQRRLDASLSGLEALASEGTYGRS